MVPQVYFCRPVSEIFNSLIASFNSTWRKLNDGFAEVAIGNSEETIKSILCRPLVGQAHQQLDEYLNGVWVASAIRPIYAFHTHTSLRNMHTIIIASVYFYLELFYRLYFHQETYVFKVLEQKIYIHHAQKNFHFHENELILIVIVKVGEGTNELFVTSIINKCVSTGTFYTLKDIDIQLDYK